MKSDEEMSGVFKESGADLLKKETIFTCGSGMSATVLDLGFHILGANGINKLYDGSWQQYGMVPEPPFTKFK